MTEIPADAILAALGELVALAKSRARPDAALARVRSLVLGHGVELDLVWENAAFTGDYHYDVLLTAPGIGTFSLALSPADSPPWPLSGVLSGRDGELLRVNGHAVSFARAIAQLDFVWEQPSLLRLLVDSELMGQESVRRRIEPDAAHLQRAMNDFRAERRLFTRDATLAFMDERGLTQEGFEKLVSQRAMGLALRDQVADDERMQAVWERSPGAFDIADVVTLRVRKLADAKALALSLSEPSLSFHDLLEAQHLAGKRVAVAGGVIASVTRHDLSPAYAAAVFEASPGTVVGPLLARDDQEAFDLVRVLRLTIADRTEPAITERLKELAFRDWLTETRARARVEWLWGSVDETERAIS